MVYNYKTDIDYSVLKGDTMNTEIFKYIVDNFTEPDRATLPPKKLYDFLKLFCKAEGVQPSLEQYLYILCNKKRLLNEACAGAGKTTMSRYRMMLANLFYGIPGNQILALAYNVHAEKDTEIKYSSSAHFLNKFLRPRMHLDTDIVSRTFHGWCREWVKTYRAKFKMQAVNILTEQERSALMQKRVEKFVSSKGLENVLINDTLISNLLALYTFVKETVSDDNEEMWNLCSAMEGIQGLSYQDLKAIFKSYDVYKSITKQMDYTDLVDRMYDLVNDPEVCERLRRHYRFVVVDEYQDITPSMSRIIQVFMNGNGTTIEPFYDGYLTCIGDGDQSIYGFRGTDSDNCLKFRELYTLKEMPDEVRVTSMSINRRCKSVILNQAKVIIESIQNRIEKPVRFLTEGGTVTTKMYDNVPDEILQVLDDLKKVNDLSKSCICYRNNSSSIFMAMQLFDREIPFEVLRGTKPLEDFYSINLIKVLQLINDPFNLDLAGRILYRILPKLPKCYTKKTLQIMFSDYNKKLATNKNLDRKRFFEFQFNGAEEYSVFNRAMAVIKIAYNSMKRGALMSEYTPAIANLLYTNFIKGLMNGFLANSITDEYVNFINHYFSKTISYEDFNRNLKEKRMKMEEEKKKGIKLTTMHGLKGLEFNDVFVIDLKDSIYPGRELSSPNLTQEQAVKIELESRRLLYVTVTRAKDNITLYFNKRCPTRYYEFFKSSSTLNDVYDNYENNSYFVQDSFTAQQIDAVNSIEDEFVFSDEQEVFNEEPSEEFDLDSLLEDSNSELGTTDLFNEQQKEETGIVDKTIDEMNVPPQIKSILDVLNMK